VVGGQKGAAFRIGTFSTRPFTQPTAFKHLPHCISICICFGAFVIRTCGCFVYFRWLPPASDAAAAFCCCLLFYCNCYGGDCYVMVMMRNSACQSFSQSVIQSVGRTLEASHLNSCWITIAPPMAVAKTNNIVPHLHTYYIWIYILGCICISVSLSISWALCACLSKLWNYAAHSKQIWKRRESRNMLAKINTRERVGFGIWFLLLIYFICCRLISIRSECVILSFLYKHQNKNWIFLLFPCVWK